MPSTFTNSHTNTLDDLETTRFLLQKTSLAMTRGTVQRNRGDTPYSASATPIQTAPSSPRLAPRAQTLSVPGVTTSRISPNGAIVQTASKLVIVMVGLPARGKSYIVKKLARYFNWSGHNCRIFNCGDRRRQHVNNSVQDADFFDSKNVEAQTVREQLAMQTLESLIKWVVTENGTVGILDATNSTRKRRMAIMQRIHQEEDLKVLFVESICTDTELLEANMRLKLQGPDYKGRDPVEALNDFKNRVKNYEAAYETIGAMEEANDESFVQIINVGKKLVTHNIEGFLAGQAVFFLLNLNLAERLIFITRHGESEDNVQGYLGGNAPLTARGAKYAAALTRLIEQERAKFRRHQLDQWQFHPRTIPAPDDHWVANPQPRDGYYSDATPPLEKPFSVWTSSLTRSKQTAINFDDQFYDVKEFKIMDEIDSGICEGLTYEMIEKQLPQEYEARRKNKLYYRYPGGESYLDVVHRLSPVVVEVERAKHHILIISHRVISRILLSYFLNLTQEQATNLEIPLEVCYCIVPRSYGADLCKYSWDEPSNTFVEEVITGGLQSVHFTGIRT
ncbi:protein of unknown function [Taphrina deformans PYCC 5710]|uniref:6-phosphofructo-2-kinase n=1 Tax=Taphrina deformans (strain PYCC 5710 / ATCC 11124 / CBS 356.35 / IMI 108563 / JCM 9778 / NBRC 8474) TaxID=1097556 RepID=R4XG31_TAPDE|nr:protein of unknown function [Taphrina deformans PYCC 5710]|eukprot:CCG84837.1 protein of unknown function [Taphrina deformans PYCC 5710]